MAVGEQKKKTSRKRKNSGDSLEGPTRTLKQYTVEEKLEIIEFAKINGNRAAGREYNVAESSIREWRKNEDKLKALGQTDPERQRLNASIRKPTNPTSVDDIDKPPESKILHLDNIPLSLSITPETTRLSDTTDHEVSLGGESNGSTHSSSPTLSVTGSLNGCTGSSSRRKATRPRKFVPTE